MAGAAGAKVEVQREERKIENKLTDSGGEEGKEMTWEKEKKKESVDSEKDKIRGENAYRGLLYFSESMWTPERYTIMQLLDIPSKTVHIICLLYHTLVFWESFVQYFDIWLRGFTPMHP